MRILAFSDLHRDEQAGRSLVERSPQVDVVAGVGEFASMHRGLDGMIAVLSAIDRPVLLVPGNNETDDALRAACAGWPAARVLHGEVAEIDDVTFCGWAAASRSRRGAVALTSPSSTPSACSPACRREPCCWCTRHRAGTLMADSAARRCYARSSSGAPDSGSAGT